MDLWEWLEKTIPVGEVSADAAALRKKTEETTGDLRSINHMALFRFYNAEAANDEFCRRCCVTSPDGTCVRQYDQRNTIPIRW